MAMTRVQQLQARRQPLGRACKSRRLVRPLWAMAKHGLPTRPANDGSHQPPTTAGRAAGREPRAKITPQQQLAETEVRPQQKRPLRAMRDTRGRQCRSEPRHSLLAARSTRSAAAANKPSAPTRAASNSARLTRQRPRVPGLGVAAGRARGEDGEGSPGNSTKSGIPGRAG